MSDDQHRHTQPSATCDMSVCRVSDQSLNSALATFLCFPKEKSRGMDEIDKKVALAKKIAPFVDGTDEGELVGMGSEKLVSLVNLVLHGGDNTDVVTLQRNIWRN